MEGTILTQTQPKISWVLLAAVGQAMGHTVFTELVDPKTCIIVSQNLWLNRLSLFGALAFDFWNQSSNLYIDSIFQISAHQSSSWRSFGNLDPLLQHQALICSSGPPANTSSLAQNLGAYQVSFEST